MFKEKVNGSEHFHLPGKCYEIIIVTIDWKVTCREIVKNPLERKKQRKKETKPVNKEITVNLRRHALSRHAAKNFNCNVQRFFGNIDP